MPTGTGLDAQLGFKLETTYGTAVATPTHWIPLVDPKWKPVQSMLKDDALRGDMAATHQQVAGVRYDTIDYKTYLYLDTILPHMLNILGGVDTVTGAGDPYTHTIGLLNSGDGQPKSWTLQLYNGAECWQMTGAQLVQAEFDVPAEGLASSSYQWMGKPATKVSAPTNTPTALKPWAGWNTVITLAGSAAATYSSAKLTYKRETAPIHVADGTQAPYMIFVGPITVTGELVGVYPGEAGAPTDLANYLVNTQPALLVQINPVGDATHYAKWQHTTVAYDEVEVSGSAGKWMEVNAKFEAIANSTDAVTTGQSPAKFVCLTTVSAAL